MAIVAAYRKRDGEKVRIPEHWFAHPTLGGPFSKTKPAKSAGRAASAAADSKKENKNA